MGYGQLLERTQCIVVAIDAKKTKHKSWEVFTHGGRNPTGINALDYAQRVASIGAGEILLTSMDKDGTKSGFDIEITKKASKLINIPIVASGGAGKMEHIKDVFENGADAALAASIFHFREIDIIDLKKYLKNEGINVRL